MFLEIERQDGICILRAKGRLPAGGDQEYFWAKLEEIKTENCGKVLVDLREVPSIGSTGIGFLVGVYTSITKTPGGKFVLVGASRRVIEVLNLTRLSTVLEIVEDMAAGLAVLDAGSRSARGAEK
jgi:anti-sigma B factor antagonist